MTKKSRRSMSIRTRRSLLPCPWRNPMPIDLTEMPGRPPLFPWILALSSVWWGQGSDKFEILIIFAMLIRTWLVGLTLVLSRLNVATMHYKSKSWSKRIRKKIMPWSEIYNRSHSFFVITHWVILKYFIIGLNMLHNITFF